MFCIASDRYALLFMPFCDRKDDRDREDRDGRERERKEKKAVIWNTFKEFQVKESG